MTITEMSLPPDFVAGNYFDKYRSRNPIHRALVSGFVRAARELIKIANPSRVLEVGCGSGDLAVCLFGGVNGGATIDYVGIDISPNEVDRARERLSGRSCLVGTAYDLPFPNQAFDLVVMCEVLEHLDRPADGLREACRVSRSHALVSVPWEPVWRMLNVTRGKYWCRLGNTPGHVQHFSRRAIRNLVGRYLTSTTERRPFPWTMILGQRRSLPSTSG